MGRAGEIVTDKLVHYAKPDDDVVPPEPPPLVRWMYKHGCELKAIRVDFVMVSEDQSDTVWHVEFCGGHKQVVREPAQLDAILDFHPHLNVPRWRALAALKEPLKTMCEARDKWKKKHARELADYRRLKAKFEGTTNESTQTG